MSKCLFSHAALVGKPSGAIARGPEGAARDALLKVARYVNRLGIEVSIEADSANSVGITEFGALSVAQIGQRCDVVLAVGGDGTVLGIGRQMAAYDVPLVGINQGRLGFMTDIALDRLEELLGPVLHGEYEREERSMLHAEVMRAESTRNEAPAERVIFSANAMNDVVVSRGALAGMVELRVSVDGAFMYSQRADGLIVATPTGSTAYALSANGPIMHPRLGGFILVPIAPHSLSNRPIALPDSCTIDIEIAAGRDASVNFDMQSLTSLLHGDRIVVRRGPHSAVFLHPKGYSYFATLRSKLHWHEQNSQI